MPAIMGQSAHTRGHGILGERQRSESTCDPTGSIARATRTRGELERARNVRRAALRDRDEGSMEPTLMRPPRERRSLFMIRAALPRPLQWLETRGVHLAGCRALKNGPGDSRAIHCTMDVLMDVTSQKHTVSSCRRRPAGGPARPQPCTRPAAYPRRARASTCPKTCAPRMVNCKSCARLGANLARRSAHARALTIQRPSSSRP